MGANLTKKKGYKNRSCGCYRYNRIDSNRKEKQCSKCKIIKHINGFPSNKSRRDGHHQYCWDCRKRYFKNKRAKDIGYKISQNLRSRMYHAIFIYKQSNFYKLIGCGKEFLLNYIESKFLPGMTWENYGKMGWHIDHKKTMLSF